MKPRYDDKFRASAVVMLASQGYPNRPHALIEVAEHLKIPHRTLRRWANAESNPIPDDVVTTSKKELDVRLEQVAHKLIDSILINTADASLQQQAVSLGIVIEKMQLLRNLATERTEVIDTLSDDERASRVEAILNAARNRKARQTPIETIH